MRMTRLEAERIAEELADSPYPIVAISDALMQACQAEAEQLQPGPCGVEWHRKADWVEVKNCPQCDSYSPCVIVVRANACGHPWHFKDNGFACLACRRESAAGELAARETRKKCSCLAGEWFFPIFDSSEEEEAITRTKHDLAKAILALPIPTLALDAVVKAARLDELRDLVVLFGSPEFSKEQRLAYIKNRVAELEGHING